MKKLITFLISFVLTVALLLSVSVCFAEDIGTYENGIKAPEINYSQHSPLFEFDAFPNADFEQGFMYWQTDCGKYPSEVATLKEENGNHFVELNAGEAWNGICTVRFHQQNLKLGESFVLLYDWRGDANAKFDVTLIQWWVNKDNLHSHGVRVGYGNGTVLKKAKDGGFNTSMTIYNHQTLESTRANDLNELYFSFALNLCDKAKKPVQIDNLRICKYNSETGTISDLNDKALYKNIPNKGSNLKTYKEVPEKKNAGKYDEFPQYSFWNTVTFFFEKYGVVTLILVIVLAAVITVVCMINRKKRKKQS